MTEGRKAALAAFSLANLLFMRVWYELNHLQHDPQHQYFLARAAETRDYLLAIAGMTICALLLFLLFRFSLFARSETAKAVGAVITWLLLLRIVFLVIGLSDMVPEVLWWEIQDEAGELWDSRVAVPALLVAAFAPILIPRSRRVIARSGTPLTILLTVLMPFGCVMIAYALMHAMRAPEPVAASAPAVRPARAPGTPRVIVAVFDEMDYRLVFAEPPAGMKLNGLARLRGSSLFATHAFPPSNATAISMPAMLTNQHVLNVQVAGWSTLNLFFEKDRIASWKDADTLFHRAHRAGFSSGIIGWYHPYCRLFPMAADCLSKTAYGYATSYNVGNPLEVMGAQLRQIIPVGEPYAERCYRNSIERFKRMIANPSFDLVFAHLSFPHAPYIYDAQSQELASSDRMAPVSGDTVNYFSNLILVDRVVNSTLDFMQSSCASCTLIVTSDHWWRWSRHYDGHTDRRVPFIVHVQSDGKPLVYDRKFNNQLLSPLAMQLLEGKLKSHAEVATWLRRNGKPLNPAVAPWMIDEDRLATSLEPPTMPTRPAN